MKTSDTIHLDNNAESDNLIHTESNNLIHTKNNNLINNEDDNLINVESDNLIHSKSNNLIHAESDNLIHTESNNLINNENDNLINNEDDNLINVESDNLIHIESNSNSNDKLSSDEINASQEKVKWYKSLPFWVCVLTVLLGGVEGVLIYFGVSFEINILVESISILLCILVYIGVLNRGKYSKDNLKDEIKDDLSKELNKKNKLHKDK